MEVSKKRKRSSKDLKVSAEPAKKKSATVSSNVVYISNLKSSTTKQSAIAYFSKFGTVKKVDLFATPESKSYGFVEFSGDLSIDDIISKTHKLDGNKIVCQEKKSPVAKEVKTFEKSKYEALLKLHPSIIKGQFDSYMDSIKGVQQLVFPRERKNNKRQNRGFAIISFKTSSQMNSFIKVTHKINGHDLTAKSVKDATDADKKCEFVVSKDHGIMLNNLPTGATV